MDVATSYMKSVSWAERWFWFGAMYDMVWGYPPSQSQLPQAKHSDSKGLTP